MMDFVVPNGNEEELILMAKRLGYESLCFVYSMKDFKKTEDGFKAYAAILEDKNFDRAKQKADFVIAKAGPDVRGVIERGRVDFIYGFEESAKRDFTHHRNSGLNQVLCKLMNLKEIGYLVNLYDLAMSKDPQLLGRVMQNIRFCSKFKVKTAFGSFASSPFEMKGANDVQSLMKIL